jgi:predicted double-glycine peptidase
MALWAMASSASAQLSYESNYAGASIRLPLTTYQDRQFARVIKQQTDFSCGSASVATLLTYHYGIPATEADVFRAMWEKGEQDQIRERGFSLLDMKRYLASIDMLADGYSLPLEKLEEIGVPAIALVDIQGYKHFVVIKGIRGDRVLLGDPSRGLIVRSRAEFEEVWDGTVFFVRSFLDRGRAGWNRDEDWAAHPAGRPADGPTFADIQGQQLDRARAFDSAFGFAGRF